jgi:hypothetical protein
MRVLQAVLFVLFLPFLPLHRLITFRGETKCLAEWAADFGLRTPTLWNRLDDGWSMEKALTTPVRGAVNA